jgi:hypothetical protein
VRDPSVHLQDFDRIINVSGPLIVLADNVHGNFRPQLRLWIFAASFQELPRHLSGSD